MMDEDKEKIKRMVSNITIFLEKNYISEDKEKIKYLSEELKKIEKTIPSNNKMEELKKIEVDLEVRYDDFNELGNYFDPLYIFLKNKIHEEKVKKLRKESKRKRVKK
jgi:hypothetical protein